MEPTFKFRATCHTRCFWRDTLWEPGEVYEGDEPPNKHFNETGVSPEKPPPEAADDPRSNNELRAALKKHPFNFTAPSKWTRKQVWAKLREMEAMYEKDAVTSPRQIPNMNTDTPQYKAACGKICKTAAGLANHERRCGVCKSKKENDEKPAQLFTPIEDAGDGDTSGDMQPGAA